ncbi:MAG: hypothetical protein J0M17_22905 [Planctomycetes bacterium]|nr:hypothetical protein [Planctomycetota bacterium]
MADDRPLHSHVAYHPYMALLAHFDHAKALRTDVGPRDPRTATSPDGGQLAGNAVRFQYQCDQLKQELLANVLQYSCDYEPEPFPEYLFRPLCLAALGHSDDFGLTLIDHFVAAARLTAVAQGAEDSDLAFCPVISSIPLPPDDAPPRRWTELQRERSSEWPFYEPHELFSSLRISEPLAGASRLQEVPDAPLCVVTNLKTNILAEMPHGLRMQEAVYATIVSTIRRTLWGMLQPAESSTTPLYSDDDVLCVRCLLLEPQGAEDITLVCFCNNYSVANTVLAVIRTLTIRDALRNAPQAVAESVSRSELHAQITAQVRPEAAKATGLGRLTADEILAAVGGNHLFMRSYSTLCFAYGVLAGDRRSEVRGVCEARIYFDVSPGHEAEISACFDEAIARTFDGDATRTLPLRTEELALTTHGILPGAHDMSAVVYPHSTMQSSGKLLIPCQIFFSFLSQFFKALQTHQRNRTPAAALTTTETGFMDLTSSLTIRTPLVGATNLPQFGEFLPDGRLPRPVDWSSHLYGMDYFVRIRRSVAKRLRLDELLDFREKLRSIGCPSSLQYSLLYMCQEFLDCLEDPLRCEAVLDLYDPIAMLLGYLGDAGPMIEHFSAIEPDWMRRALQSRFFTRGRFKSYIDALQDAFTLRIQRVIPHHEFRDTAFNLRAGASKLIAAMDVPLKCSIGLFRSQVGAREDRDSVARRLRFGSITTLNTRQHTTVSFGVWPNGRDPDHATPSTTAPRFGFMAVDMDVFHLFRPEQAYYFLHEVAHLFLYAQQQASPADRRNIVRLSCDTADRYGAINAESRTSEVFADLLAALFVFEGDVELFGKFHGLAFSDITGRVVHVDANSTEAAYQLALLEVVVRGFFVAELISTLAQEIRMEAPDSLPETHTRYRVEGGPDGHGIYLRLISYAQRIGPYYRGLNHFWHPDAQDAVAGQLRRRCREISEDLSRPVASAALAEIWGSAAKIWKNYWLERAARNPVHGGDFAAARARVEQSIRQALREGRAFARTNFSATASGEDRDDGLDCLFVITRLLYEYIQLVVGSIDPQDVIFVPVPTEADSPSEPRRFARYLMLETHVPLHAVHPRARREKLRAQIAFIKTLWDLSNQLRSRRLVEMGADAFSA